ncbi:MAG: PKD domain-containing protein [Candidatus Aminicenantes bacterium]|nr:PKD domain-containing protein [Candidatus Aminicenantes bacterium]NIM82831.1 PKD domain-containing protein [Candidatus Aminicenantes bacterium]NIN22207.1 PKD domain-containing protein [Candidatus Aminicenantes bacterium]NIN45975.1 PKD domain-containing protein [Candidatus Aminicenantes bacterium]NIN88811.1 PKD domain-containing protein [Candidatus Aminicenantes bacterium]
MKKLMCMMLCLLLVSITGMYAKKDKGSDFNGATLVSSNINETVLSFEINSYDFKNVKTPQGNAKELVAPGTGQFLVKGAPELLKSAAAIIIPDQARMKVEVIDSLFTEIKNIDIAPSKGNLLRTVDPDTVPYEYGREYQINDFYPGTLAELGSPYIIRDFRGQAVIVNPFQYNPVTKVLRVYSRMTVKISTTGERGENILNPRESLRSVDPAFDNVYARHFLNYSQEEYTPLPDDLGNYLVICYNGFMSEMSDFVSWKQSIGYNVDLVDYSTIGSSAALKTYVENYYNTNGLTFLLIVGDHPQVPTSSTTAGDSDNNYGYIVGNDHYLDIFVGRFSAETVAHVTTQVDRTIHYERDVLSSAAFFRNAIGMGSAEGPGHNGEYDYQHVNNLLADLAGYGYTTYTNHQTGGSTANLANLINNGAGTMWYCGHGSNTCWTCGWTFCNSNVDALVNEWELPAVFSVACVVGNFKSITCFCESWLRATNNGNPTGAVAHAGSTINQSWNPPMDAQDEMVDLLVSVSGPKRTFGGVFVNGLFKMIDLNGAGGEDMADTWTCFGDASVQLRTPGTPEGPPPVNPEPPVADFTADKTTVMATDSVNFTDLSTNNPTSWDWTFPGGTPSTSTEKNPTITYNTPGTYDVTLTVSNSAGTDTMTKVNYITVTTLQPPVADFVASYTDIAAGDSVDFTDLSTNVPTAWDWTFDGGTPAASTDQNPTITYNTPGTYTVTLTATNSVGSDTETKVDYINVAEKPYCASQGNIFSMEWIAGVQVGTMNNPSGAAGYTDFTSITCNLTAGDTVNVVLTPGFSGSTYTEYWKIWIDYNGDHDFEDAGEEVFSGFGSSTVSGSFTVQSGVDIVTRMRVSMKYAGYPTPCETFTYGEVEDYTADIGPGTGQPPVADFEASFTTINEGDTVAFTDLSTNNPDAWDWTFEGGTPGTSTEQHPMTITYNTAGTYDVTLVATNPYGSDTETKVGYITVLPAGSCIGEITNPGFETGTTSGWTDTGSVSIISDSHSGSYAVSLDGAGSRVEQVITGLCANTTYTVSAWGIAKSQAGLYLGVSNYGGADQTVQFTDFKNYVQESITFTTGASNTSVTIYLNRTGSKFNASGDDFEIVKN